MINIIEALTALAKIDKFTKINRCQNKVFSRAQVKQLFWQFLIICFFFKLWSVRDPRKFVQTGEWEVSPSTTRRGLTSPTKRRGIRVFFFISYPFCLFIRRISSVLLFLFLVPFYYIVMCVCLLNLNKSEVVISSLCSVWHKGCTCMIRCLNWVTLVFFLLFTWSAFIFVFNFANLEYTFIYT